MIRSEVINDYYFGFAFDCTVVLRRCILLLDINGAARPERRRLPLPTAWPDASASFLLTFWPSARRPVDYMLDPLIHWKERSNGFERRVFRLRPDLRAQQSLTRCAKVWLKMRTAPTGSDGGIKLSRVRKLQLRLELVRRQVSAVSIRGAFPEMRVGGLRARRASIAAACFDVLIDNNVRSIRSERFRPLYHSRCASKTNSVHYRAIATSDRAVEYVREASREFCRRRDLIKESSPWAAFRTVGAHARGCPA
ncbi:hypothetical protein EVAR_237_1 [Eumeta japonica]|uniref:Uncharacterized protein n=1 Tax=Eumeta variegata TaxID=151549 RepID=A0A4C1SCC9_EUMVA|nr:hypothetical protein EVAR_237_1 [Eumeta japonica]